MSEDTNDNLTPPPSPTTDVGASEGQDQTPMEAPSDSTGSADAPEGGSAPDAPGGAGAGEEAKTPEIAPSDPPSPTTNVEASAFDKSSADKSDGQAGQEKPNFISGLLAKARERIQFNKTKKLNKIIELAKKRERITNSMVCKELRISDSTAVRYLNLLEKQGKLVQVGKTGRDAFYQVVE